MVSNSIITNPIGIKNTDRMSGLQFEIYLEWLFRRLAYRVEMTPKFDFGADLIIERNRIRTAVQAKQRIDEMVGIDAVRAVFASMPFYECKRSMVVTNGLFSWQARKLAKATNVELWDRLQLAGKMASVRRLLRNHPDAPGIAHPATCFQCGELVPERVRQYCMTNARLFRGRILCRKHQRLPDLGRHRAAG